QCKWNFLQKKCPLKINANAKRFFSEGFVYQTMFSHYHLDYTPVTAQYQGKAVGVEEGPPTLWYDPSSTQDIGLPKPVKHLIDKVQVNGATVVSRGTRSKNQP
ncbi:MAG: hypothetical protein DSY87_05275, partial [Methylococcus sp.]